LSPFQIALRHVIDLERPPPRRRAPLCDDTILHLLFFVFFILIMQHTHNQSINQSITNGLDE